MPFQVTLSFILTFFSLWAKNSLVYATDKYMYLQLDRATPYFESQTALWTLTNQLNSPVYSTMCSTQFLGGPTILDESGGYKLQYTSLPTHASVSLTLDLAFLGVWGSGDFLVVNVGGLSTNIDFAKVVWGTGIACFTDGLQTLFVSLSVTAQHTATDLSISLIKTTSLLSRQFGVRDVKITLNTQDKTSDGSFNFCFLANSNGSPSVGSMYSCTCAEGKYADTSSVCQSCHESCGTCKGSASNCLTCADGYTYDGQTCIKCDSSCKTCTGTGANQCSSCADGVYLASDNTCQSTCSSSTEQNGDLFCDSTPTPTPTPTPGSSQVCPSGPSGEIYYYYPDDQTCKSACPDPYVISTTSCVLPLSQERIDQIRAISSAASTGADVMTGGLIAMSVLDISSPNLANSGKLARMFEYTRYIDVHHSPELEVFYKSHRTVPGTVVIAPTLTNENKEKFGNDPIPGIFQRYNLHSNFIVNFWNPLMTLLIISCVYIFIYALELLAKKFVPKYSKYVPLARFAVFSFLIGQFYNVYSEIVLFSTINFRSFISLENALSWVGFFVGLCLLLFSFAVIGLHARLLHQYQEFKAHATSVEDAKNMIEKFQKEHGGVDMLYKAYKDVKLITQSYFLLLTFRNLLFSLIIGTLFDHTIAQVLLLMILNGATIAYMVIKKPFIEFFAMAQQIAFEGLMALVNLCFLIMACSDAAGTTTEKSRYALGQIVMVCIFISKFVPVISIAPKVVTVGKKLYKKYQAKKKAKKVFIKDLETGAKMAKLNPTTPSEQNTPVHMPLKAKDVAFFALGYEAVPVASPFARHSLISKEPSKFFKKEELEQESVISNVVDADCLKVETGLLFRRPSRITQDHENTPKNIESLNVKNFNSETTSFVNENAPEQ